MTDGSHLAVWLERLDSARVLVIGDVMLDRFIHGSVARISPEAPVPVLTTQSAKPALGGAGNVVNNLRALGAQVSFVSVVGADPEAEEIRRLLESSGVSQFQLLSEKGRQTTVKTRFVAERQQVLRVDTETVRSLEGETEDVALRKIQEFLEDCDAVVISDYGKGLLSPTLLSELFRVCRLKKVLTLVDPKGTDFSRYQGASVLTPNIKELSEATGMAVDTDEAVSEAARRLIQGSGVEAVLATRGPEGMSLVDASGRVVHQRAESREVFDVSGAGDTVIATLAAACSIGAPLEDAAHLANVAAGIVVGKIGTAVARPNDILQALHREELSSAEAKVLDFDSAVERVEKWKRQGYKIGFTNGFFDLFHRGHLSLLRQASEVCDRLVVGLNGDESVRRLRGEDSLQSEATRGAILASLELVDLVVIFQEKTPERLLEALRPDFLIKGANYRPEEVVGAEIVTRHGGQVILAELSEADVPNATISKMTKGTL